VPVSKRAYAEAKERFGAAFCCYLIGFVFFLILYAVEQSGKNVIVPDLIAVLNLIGGKWLVAGFCAYIGTNALVQGIRRLCKKDE
jgi:hypothetical protein